MKNVLLFFTLILSMSYLQAQNVDKLKETKRKEVLLKNAKAALLKYAPDYYREFGEPEITHMHVHASRNNDGLHEQKANNNINRSYYSVKYFYDKTQEAFPLDYVAIVYLWGDTGKAFSILFTNLGIDLEAKEKEEKLNPNKPIRKMSWQKREPGAFDPPKPRRDTIKYIPKEKERKVSVK